VTSEQSFTGTLFETPRLRLREFVMDDVERLVALDSDPEVMRHISHGIATPRDVIREKVLPNWLELYEQPRPIGFWAVELREDGQFIGWFHLRPDWLSPPEPELGYRLVRRVWGRGLASEGGRALVAAAFDRLPCDSISARTLVVNEVSQRVMLNCGMRFESEFTYPAEMLPTWSEEERRAVKYSVSREDWQRNERVPPR
jgi:RimJ/RimL family protein N-acetyltransferase